MATQNEHIEKALKIIEAELPLLSTRRQIQDIVGGTISVFCLRRLDRQEIGIKGRVLIGRTVVYPRPQVLEFLRTWMGPTVHGQDITTFQERRKKAKAKAQARG